MAADRLAYGDAAYVPLRSSASCPRIPRRGALFGNDIGRIVELAAEEGSDGSELEKPGAGTIELHNVAQVVIHGPHVTQEIDCDAVGGWEGKTSAKCLKEDAIAGEFLDPLIVGVGYPGITRGIEGNTEIGRASGRGRVQISGVAATL